MNHLESFKKICLCCENRGIFNFSTNLAFETFTMDTRVENHIVPSRDHLNILSEKFGHVSFKTEQWNAISQLIYQKKDVFICAGSGFGKSLIYQFPAVFLGKKAVVISPLISLMETQVQKLESRGISACFISGNQKNANISLKEYTVIYSTPENFATIHGIIKWAAENEHVALIAIDEAHCISKTSSDHRPSYTFLRSVKESFPNLPLVALTSTASKETTASICKALSLNNPLMLKTPLNRPNIEYISIPQSSCFITDVKRFLLDLHKDESAIIYVFKRAETENYSEILTSEGFETKPYHSGLVEEIRRETLRDFMSGRLNFLVTTNAFGMGVDRSNVRVVIHYGIPKNPETYYMESGRGGRDGKPSKSIIFWSDRDYKFHNYCFKENYKKKIASNQDYAHNQALLAKMQEYTVIKKCRRVTLLKYLEENIPEVISDTCCDNCLLALHEKVGISKMYKEINSDGELDITADARMVLNLINSYQGKCKYDMLVDFITGSRPTNYNPKHPVEYFAVGVHKSKSWWYNILKIVKDKRLIDRYTIVRSTENIIELWAGITRDDYVRTTPQGIKFMRLKSKELKVFPKSEFYQSMTKTDIEYYIVDDVLNTKPRVTVQNDAQTAKDDSCAFDFSALSTQLTKASPRKRLASECSDVSIGDFFKSPSSDCDSSLSFEKSPKIQKISEAKGLDRPAIDVIHKTDLPVNNSSVENQPGCSHWCLSGNSGSEDQTANDGESKYDKKCINSGGIKKCTVKVPMLKLVGDGQFVSESND